MFDAIRSGSLDRLSQVVYFQTSTSRSKHLFVSISKANNVLFSDFALVCTCPPCTFVFCRCKTAASFFALVIICYAELRLSPPLHPQQASDASSRISPIPSRLHTRDCITSSAKSRTVRSARNYAPYTSFTHRTITSNFNSVSALLVSSSAVHSKRTNRAAASVPANENLSERLSVCTISPSSSSQCRSRRCFRPEWEGVPLVRDIDHAHLPGAQTFTACSLNYCVLALAVNKNTDPLQPQVHPFLRLAHHMRALYLTQVPPWHAATASPNHSLF